jgi:drug/metabolite transporter (DMT)-like permease
MTTRTTVIQQPSLVPWRAYGALAVGTVCIAMSAIFVKWAAVPGPVSAFYRVFIAAVVLAPMWLAGGRFRLPRRAVLVALACGLFFGIDLALWNTSILMTSAATATLLANNAPLWVGLGALLLFRERLPASFWTGMTVALVGAALILASDILEHPTVGQGDLLAMGAGLFYALYMLGAQRARAKLDTRSFMALSMISAVVVLLAMCLLMGLPLVGYSRQSWSALLGLGLMSQLGGWLAINYALGHIRATVTSVSLLGQIVLTALFAIPLLGEHLSMVQITGGLLVLGGIYLVHRRG